MRQTTRSRVVTVCLTVAIAIAAGEGHAAAATAQLFDPRGDAPASADVLSYTISNGTNMFTVAVNVRNLAAQSDITLFVNQAGAGQYVLRTGPVGKGDLTFARGTTETPIECNWSLLRQTGQLSTMTVGIPQKCFGARAGDAWVNFIMWQAGGPGADHVTKAFVPRG